MRPQRRQPIRLPRSLGFSRQEHWSGLPFPSPKHESEKWKWSCSVVSDPQRPHGLQPTRLLHPWDFPGKSTGVGCHCLEITIFRALCHHLKKSWVCSKGEATGKGVLEDYKDMERGPANPQLPQSYQARGMEGREASLDLAVSAGWPPVSTTWRREMNCPTEPCPNWRK